MRLSWKLLPLAAVVALGVAVLMPGGGLGPQSASADVNTIVADDSAINSGSSTGITVDLSADNPTITISAVADGDATATLTIDDCDPECSEEGESGAEVNITSNSIVQVELTLALTCEEDDVITVTAEQGESSDEVEVDCNAVESNVTVSKVAEDDDDLDFDFSIDGAGANCDGSFVLADGESAGFACEDDGETEITITEDVPDGWSVTIDCDGVTDEEVDEENGSITFVIDEDDEVDCTFTNELTGTVTPGAADSVTVSVSSNNPSCNLPVVVVATVRDDAGDPLGGAEVTFSAPKGSFTIAEGTTSASGVISTLYQPPSTGSESIVITATANGKSGTATITTNCEAAPTATSVPPTAVPTATGGIQPPSTGDGGLASDSNTWLFAVAGILAVSGFAGAIVARRRA